MFKKLLFAAALAIASIGFAFAQVDVNRADQAALDGVKGIGPVMSKTIIEERKKGGDFKDWVDFEKRVKGIGDKNSTKLSQAGLTINGQAKSNAPAAVKSADKTSKAAAKTASKVAPAAAPTAAGAAPDVVAKPAKMSKAEAKAAAKADAKAVKVDAAKASAAGKDVKK